MKKITIIIYTLLVTFYCKTTYAQDEAGMKAWQDYMTPGEVHKMLAADNGTWNEDITMWMDPAKPTKSTATAENKMILGGRYQQSNHKGSFNGMPFEGMSLLGYDNAKKAFMSSWIDNMGTGIMNMEGKWDPATKTINFTGKTNFKMKVYSPRVGAKVLLKVEGPGFAYEKEVATTVANAWHELTFDYSAIPFGFYTRIVLIFDLGTAGDGSPNYTFYVDDITLN